jgi:hypothetical protein
MKLIREYKEYTLMDKISDKLSGIFPNVKIVNNILLASSILDKSGKPNVRIDSKIPLKALMLKFEKNSIEIKSIVNSSDNLFIRVKFGCYQGCRPVGTQTNSLNSTFFNFLDKLAVTPCFSALRLFVKKSCS